MGKTLWNKYLQAYEQLRRSNGDYPATWEIAYGHAWATDKMPARKMDMDISAQPFTVQKHRK